MESSSPVRIYAIYKASHSLGYTWKLASVLARKIENRYITTELDANYFGSRGAAWYDDNVVSEDASKVIAYARKTSNREFNTYLASLQHIKTNLSNLDK